MLLITFNFQIFLLVILVAYAVHKISKFDLLGIVVVISIPLQVEMFLRNVIGW